jgi:hypothetical protein
MCGHACTKATVWAAGSQYLGPGQGRGQADRWAAVAGPYYYHGQIQQFRPCGLCNTELNTAMMLATLPATVKVKSRKFNNG